MRITAEEVTRHPFTKKVVRKYTQRLIKFGCYTEDEREAITALMNARNAFFSV